MRVVIRFTRDEEARALPILLRHSPGRVLPDRIYVISESAARDLRLAGVNFAEVSGSKRDPENRDVELL